MKSCQGAGGGKMPCESCGVQFSVFRRKRACSECERLYCAACLRRGGGMCAPCRALSTRPLLRASITHLKPRDLQYFLHRQNVSTRLCVEKDDLVNLCVTHVNSAAYRRRGSRGAGAAAGGPFTTLKGLTNNFNEFLNSAFDMRTPAAHPAPPTSNCHNATHPHSPAGGAAAAQRERFTTRPGGEPDIVVPVPAPADPPGGAAGGVPRSASLGSARVESGDCFEIEDLDDAGWEFVTRPAEPLPNDSDVLLASPAGGEGGPPAPPSPPRSPPRARLGAPATPARAASTLELHRAAPDADDGADTSSLQDESLMDHQAPAAPRQHITLGDMRSPAQLEALNVKQLKELLARNRVEYRGCLERAELLERARRLWCDHAKYRDELDNLPLEECCKICMAAPLECVLLECGHIAACTACSTQLAECPICRQYVVRAVRFFRS